MSLPRVVFKGSVPYIISSVFLLSLNFIPVHLKVLAQTGNRGEEFDRTLVSRIQTVEDLLRKTDSIIAIGKGQDSLLQYVTVLTDLVQKRFYHGYSYYSLQENWIAALSGKLLWSNLSAIVLPNDILKYPMAACSQQAIVVMECLKRKGITYREIGFDNHFALEAKCGDRWYYFDTNLEPDFSKIHRASIQALVNQNALYSIYKAVLDSSQVAYALAHPFYGKANENPAPRASIFQCVTKVLSKVAFLAPLLYLYVFSKRSGLKASKNANVRVAKPSII